MNKSVLAEQLRIILDPIVRCFNTIGSYGDHDSCHGEGISWFELFCRSSYGIIPYTITTGDKNYLQAFSDTLLKVVSDTRYSTFKDYDQKAVELVPVAALLVLFRDCTWDKYPTEKRKEIENYFCKINEIALCNNNWMFFRILVCAILQDLTKKDYSFQIRKSWQVIDSFYKGDGWYRDGLKGPKDYYNAFGFHFYSLLYYYLFDDIERNNIIKERAVLFAKQYVCFFDKQGRSIPYGRSLIYRYASLSFWSMMLVNGLLNEEDEKLASSIISNNFEWWSKQSVYDKNSFQTLGYAYPNEYMLEDYNSSGSVYWSLKFFMILLSDDNSIIWSGQDLSEGVNDGFYRIANGDFLVQVSEHGNIAFPNSYKGSGQAQDFAKYMHFAYNSATGFNISKSENNFANLSDDSSLIFNINGRKQKRKENLCYSCKGNTVQEFVWCIDDLIDIVTTIIPLDDFYIRIHVICSRIACECFETGFPIRNSEELEKSLNSTVASVKDKNMSSFICLVKGQGVPYIIQNEEYSNIYYKDTTMPCLRYELKKGVSVIVDSTGFSSVDIPLNIVAKNVTNCVKIIDNTAIISSNEANFRIPLYVTSNVSRQLFFIKKKKQYRAVIGKLKKLVKILIKR